MKILCVWLWILCSLCYGFYDERLERVWSSIENINNPTLEEYRLLENYLANDRRFLDVPNVGGYIGRLNAMRNFKLIGPNGEMPIFEWRSFNITQNSKNRCIVLFASHNGTYAEKARTLVSELEKQGYSGHLLLRIGGFPNIQNGGLRICHVPYAFKLAFLQEAKALGFKEVLWLDLALHPLTDLEMFFSEIKRNGYFFTSVGSLQDNEPSHRLEAAETLGVTKEMYRQIPHLSSSMIGLNMENPKAIRLLEEWYKETEKVYSSVSWFPEELSFSVVAWRLGFRPFSWFGTVACLENELNWIFEGRPTVQVYLDSRR